MDNNNNKGINVGNIVQVDINKEMKKSYINYAMSVIVGRALPDVRDGLKPVHRRVLYSMYELSLTPDKPYRKCARIVGDVLGKYHPHGDSSVYDALVRMAQDFSIRNILVDGHGNFGSVDGDGAAAMRYTEARMSKISMEMIRDINKNTVDFEPNFDGSENEPKVLPSRFPNLLVNGSSGIAVGMATNIPPHNLGEVIDGLIMLIDNSECSILDLMTKIKGPDFPTAGIIMGTEGIKEAYETGRGRIVIRAKTEIEEENGRHKIIVNEIPYQVNKAKLIEYIAELVKDKRIVGISDLRDESDRDGMRIVIEIKKDGNPNVILNQLFKHSKLQDTFGIIMLTLVNNEPKILNLKEILTYYLEFQKEIIERRTRFELEKAESRAHILEGLKIALDNIDEVINIIRSSGNTEEARNRLMERFSLSKEQSQAIVDMRLRALTGLERQKIEDELAELVKLINHLKEILANEQLVLNIIKDELLEIRAKHADERRSEIQMSEDDINIEDLIEEKNVVITLTNRGYIKRIAEDTYSSQKRGGKGIQAMNMRQDDFVEHVFVTSTHSDLLYFTNKGRVYRLKAYEVPDAGRVAKGTNLINMLPLQPEESIQAVLAIRDYSEFDYLIIATKKGLIKKTKLTEYMNIRKNGLAAITLKDGDELLKIKPTKGDANLLVVTQNGYAIVFNEKDIRPMGRVASGVRSIKLRDNDMAITLDIIGENECVFVVSENAFGKRTKAEEYKIQQRGGKGVKTYKMSSKTGKIVGARVVKEEDELMLINTSGIAIRINVADISITNRDTMGVTLMRNGEQEQIVAIAKIASEIEEVGDEV